MTIFSKSYIVCPTLIPTTLTINTVYLSIRNIGVGMVYLKRFIPNLIFAGTNAGTSTAIALLRQTATPTGGTVLVPTKINSAQTNPAVEVRFSAAGLGGVAPSVLDRFHLFGITSQNAAIAAPQALEFEDDNLFGFIPGECLLVIAQTTVISGVGMFLPFLLYEP